MGRVWLWMRHTEDVSQVEGMAREGVTMEGVAREGVTREGVAREGWQGIGWLKAGSWYGSRGRNLK